MSRAESGSTPPSIPPGPAPAVAPDIWLLAVSLAAGLGAARLTRAPGAAHVVGPITATVLAGHLATSVAKRLRVSAGAAAVAGVVAVALATIWGELLSATRYGFPTPGTWRKLVSEFAAAGTVIRSHPTPVPATPEIVLCIATGAGLVAVWARALWAWQEARGSGALSALVPSFGLFCYTALLSSQVDRLPGAIAYLACTLAFVIAADRVGTTATSRSGSGPAEPRDTRLRARSRPATPGASFSASSNASSNASPDASPDASTDHGTGSWRLFALSARRRLASAVTATLPAVLGAVLAVVVPLAANPALRTLKVNALPFAQPAGSIGAQGLGLSLGNSAEGGGGVGAAAVGGFPGSTGVRAIDLVDDLKAVLVNRTTELMFSAQTPLPTYWQLAVLTRFNGTAWLPDPTTEAAAQSDALLPPNNAVPGLPALPEPTPGKTFRAQVTIANLESTLLPLPPSTVAVDTNAVDVVPGFGALQPFEAAPGLSYVTVARIPAATTGASGSAGSAGSAGAGSAGSAGSAGAGSAGSATSGAIAPGALAPYLQLPNEPASVVQLAHQIVAGASGPAAEAAALARWFDTGRYRYTLSPPAPKGPNALQSFLFTTRAGFCQQFAAAYAVLARTDGLPTRVAVGFTTGTTRGHARYQVTGADAHVWPEVYLGPSTGWTSYEPTPASSGEAAGVGVNTGSRTSPPIPGVRSTATTASTTPTLRRPAGAKAALPTTIPLLHHGTTPVLSSHGGSWWAALAIATSGVALVVLVVVAVLRARRRARPGRDPLRLLRLALRRRRHRRRRRLGHDPTAEVLAQWRDAEMVLERARLGRRPAETLQEHAARLQSLASAKWLTPYRPVTVSSPAPAPAPGPGTTATPGSGTTATPRSGARATPGTAGTSIDDTVDAYERLAALAARASYASDPCTPEEAADAELLGALVRSGLARPSGRRRDPVPF